MNQKSRLAIGIVLALSFALVAFSAGKTHSVQPASAVVANATNAAYRDGLYTGRRAAEAGSKPVAATTRWVSAEDRQSFSAGYSEAYNQVAATTR